MEKIKNPEKIYLTKKEFERLKKELEERIKRREEIAALINSAKELGDLSENSEYISAKEEQAFNELRIREIQTILKYAEIPENMNGERVSIGNIVKLKANNEIKEFEIVSPEGIDLDNGKISYLSPLGQALLNKRVGEKVEIVTPKGKIEYKIIEIK
jgi:transcription elongation factor GreA